MAIGNSFEDPALSYECGLTAERDRYKREAGSLEARLRDMLALYENANAGEAKAVRERDALAEALRGALDSYRERWSHPGTDKTGHLLPAPNWVQQGRALLRDLGEL